tara:strand:- start:275 stop:580 length:306 start_codon:yes stop_codon:yes gene_type:complete
MTEITGWGRQAWGDGPFGDPSGVDVAGLAMTVGLGAVSIRTKNLFSIVGVGTTFSVGATTFTSSLNVRPAGVAGTLGVGTVNIYEQIDTEQTPNYNDILTS